MEEPLYLNDCYLKEFEATVKEVNGRFVVLDKTAFYPEGGGQPSDQGLLKSAKGNFIVKFVKKISGTIQHEVDNEGLEAGDKIKGEVDWYRRYRLMRYHTAAHVVSGVVNSMTGALITGNQLGEDKSRVDFDLENFNPDILKEVENKSNDAIKKAIPVLIENMPREKAMEIPSVFKLKMMLPESLQTIRVVSIGDVDRQACGGTHLKNTSEIKRLTITKTENKGKNNRRLYFVLNE